MSSGNVFNEKNLDVIAQKFIKGQEYIVNTVSYNGRHHITDIWRKYKRNLNNVPVNEYSEIVFPSEPCYQQLKDYVFQVLNALEIKFGAGHNEVMMTTDGPILIETGARLAGSIDPSAVTEAIGSNQVNALLNIYLNPTALTSNAKQDSEIKKYIRHVFFISKTAGRIIHEPDLSPILNLPSFHSMAFRPQKNDLLEVTSTLVNFPGFFYLVSTSKEQLEADYISFRQQEDILFQSLL
jgi:biotin carboxylase